jgi:uncharacterized membrane protein YvbJ
MNQDNQNKMETFLRRNRPVAPTSQSGEANKIWQKIQSTKSNNIMIKRIAVMASVILILTTVFISQFYKPTSDTLVYNELEALFTIENEKDEPYEVEDLLALAD